MSDLTVSAGEAARRLGVAPTTIQRWVDSGVLHAERTPGGHRRIYVTELRRLIAANRPIELSGPLADWLDVLMTGEPRKVKTALLNARQKADSWAETADEIASAIAELAMMVGGGSVSDIRGALGQRDLAAWCRALRCGNALRRPCTRVHSFRSKASATLWGCRWQSWCLRKRAGGCSGSVRDHPQTKSSRSSIS